MIPFTELAKELVRTPERRALLMGGAGAIAGGARALGAGKDPGIAMRDALIGGGAMAGLGYGLRGNTAIPIAATAGGLALGAHLSSRYGNKGPDDTYLTPHKRKLSPYNRYLYGKYITKEHV